MLEFNLDAAVVLAALEDLTSTFDSTIGSSFGSAVLTSIGLLIFSDTFGFDTIVSLLSSITSIWIEFWTGEIVLTVLGSLEISFSGLVIGFFKLLVLFVFFFDTVIFESQIFLGISTGYFYGWILVTSFSLIYTDFKSIFY